MKKYLKKYTNYRKNSAFKMPELMEKENWIYKRIKLWKQKSKQDY